MVCHQTFCLGERALTRLHCGAGRSCFDYAFRFALSPTGVLALVLQALMILA